MHGVLLQIAYDGSALSGWAPQRDVRTGHGVVLGAIVAMDEAPAELRGTSRTDAGVHAESQLAAFDARKLVPPKGWVLGLNSHLPPDVAVRRAWPVPTGFAPRFAAVSKRYRYRLTASDVRHPLVRGTRWRVGAPLDVERMRDAAAAFVGTHDYGAFHSAADERASTVCHVSAVAVEVTRDGWADDDVAVDVVVDGKSFLYNMVRIMVGTLVDVGTGRRPVSTVAEALRSRARGDAGITAPPHGLTLERVELAWPEGAGEPWPPIPRDR